MKKIIGIFLLLLATGIMAQGQDNKMTWQEIDRQELASQKWVKAQGSEKVLQMGMSDSKAVELEWIKAFFPYLLPKQFFNRNLFLTCYPSFVKLKKEKSPELFTKWQNCHLEIWRDSLPPLLKQAFQDLASKEADKK
jgi:hypothetical protein